MGEKLPKREGMLPYANSNEFADSLGENQSSPTPQQPHFSLEQQQKQKKIALQEQENAENELDGKLDFFSEMIGEDVELGKKDEYEKVDETHVENYSVEDKIKVLNKKLRAEGKPLDEILKTLISRFGKEKSVSLWVKNWKNFLRLHEIAEKKPPAERAAIQQIIYKADFSSSSAFAASLKEIQASENISEATKLEISQEFGGGKVKSVKQMDRRLKKIQKEQKRVSQAIESKNAETENLKTEVSGLKKQLEDLSPNDQKRKMLEKEIREKKATLEETENAIKLLTETKKDVSFTLREGITAKLNPDGSRSIIIDTESFEIRLPSNNLPLTSTKNVRSVNLVFPLRFLKSQNVEKEVFALPVRQNGVPSRAQRNMGHLILSSLGFHDSQILSEENILQLREDISRLCGSQKGKSGRDNLIALKIFDIKEDKLNKEKLREVLEFIKENRGLTEELFTEKMKQTFV